MNVDEALLWAEKSTTLTTKGSALKTLAAELERIREALERIADDADCTDMEECKHVAREALKGGY